MRNTEKSRLAFDEAKQYMPGGVNSPVRSFANVGGNPLFIARAQGSKIYDIDGNEYIDYVGSWGPMIVGHAHPQVGQAMVLRLSLRRSWQSSSKTSIRPLK